MKRLLTVIAILFTLTIFTTVNLYSQIVINEYSVSNLSTVVDNYGNYEDWIELYNVGTAITDIGGYFLSDDPDEPTKWQFPEGSTIQGHGFVRVWASGRNEVSGSHYHTSFKLSQTKDNTESIVLSDAFGLVLDALQLEITQKGHSRGRMTNGGSNWGIFTQPTPNATNNNATSYLRYTEKPQMTMTAGFYDSPITVVIFTNEPESVIRYTIDGSEPTTSSPTYVNPVNISNTTIVNARTFSTNTQILPGLIEFNTYFINEEHTLSVISASAAQLDDLLNGNQSLRPFGTFEYFNKEGVRTTFGYGEFNEHGQDSWVHPQRSIDYITRDECGYNYAIREQIIPLTDRDEFQRVILRAAGDDNYPGIDTSALLRDFFVQNWSQKNGLHLDVRKGEKGVLYVNGQFWGVYGYREKVNDHDFTDYYYGQDKYHLYYLMLWGSSWAEYGGQAAWNDWNTLHSFIKNNNMADPENFAYVKSKYDYTSLVDYILINSFVVCSDWINWNVGWWRGTNPEGGHLRWGYVLWDEDATFGHYINYTGIPGQNPYVSPCFPEGLWNDPEEHIVVLNKLRANAEFNQYYINRYVDLYNTAFRPEKMIGYLDSIEAGMLPEMQQHCQRWGGSVDEWQSNVNKIRNFINIRYGVIPQGLINCYDLTGPYEVVVKAEPAQAGNVQLNSLLLSQNQWSGVYFGGVDLKLQAIAADINYEFDYWEVTNHAVFPNDTVENVTINLTSAADITAHFKEKIFSDSLVINEINYNSHPDFDPGDWVEFYNPHEYDLDISGWIFKDSDDEHIFTFPANTILPTHDYIVLCRDTTDFKQLFPTVTNIVGNMDFGLDGAGELIRLYDETQALIDTVLYDDNFPWPDEPDGNGPTLELINPYLDNSLAENWMASPEHGTPGAMNSQMVSVAENNYVRPAISLEIFPNPVKETATLKFNFTQEIVKGEICIYNFHGIETKRMDYFGQKEIKLNCKNMIPGIYFCKMTDQVNQNQIITKFVIQ